VNCLCAALAFLFAYLVFALAPEVRVDYTPVVRSSR
jgi:hypothetical protein